MTAPTTTDEVPPVQAPETASVPSAVPSTEVERTADGLPLLAITYDQARLTEAQRAALASIGLQDTPSGDIMAFWHLCQVTGLDPFRREIYLIGRRDSDSPSGKKWSAQTGIDGFRYIAERTGLYGGQVSTEWCGPDGQWTDVWLSSEPPRAARVRVKRTDHDHYDTGTVMYDEYVPLKDEYKDNRKTGNKVPSGQWGKMPAHMLAKCSLAFAIRTAFPRQTAGIYVAEEMHRADVEDAEQAQEARAQMRADERQRALHASGSAFGAQARPVRVPVEVRRPSGDDGKPMTIVDQHGAVLSTVYPDGMEPQQPDDVMDGPLDVPPPGLDKYALLAVLTDQAGVMGTTRAAWCNRWVKSHRKNVEDADATELLALVESRQAMVEEKAALDARHAAESAATAPEPTPEPEAAPEPPAPPVDAAAGEHRYVEDHDAKDGTCKVCAGDYYDARHGSPDANAGDDDGLLPDL